MPTQTRRALTSDQLTELCYLAHKYKELQEHAINGDPHPLYRVDGSKSAHVDASSRG